MRCALLRRRGIQGDRPEPVKPCVLDFPQLLVGFAGVLWGRRSALLAMRGSTTITRSSLLLIGVIVGVGRLFKFPLCFAFHMSAADKCSCACHRFIHFQDITGLLARPLFGFVRIRKPRSQPIYHDGPPVLHSTRLATLGCVCDRTTSALHEPIDTFIQHCRSEHWSEIRRLKTPRIFEVGN